MVVGIATKESVGNEAGIFNGMAGRPLFVQVYGVSACKINLISGSFAR